MKRSLSWLHSFDFIKIIKYYAVGAIVNVSGYAIFLNLLHIGIEHKLAASVLYLLGVFVSFWLNRTLVFGGTATLRSSLLWLLLMLLFGYVLNIAVLFACVDKLGFNAEIVQLLSIILVSIFFYLFNKFFVHKKAIVNEDPN